MPRIDPSQIGRVPSGRRSSTIDDSKKTQIPPFVWWTLGLIILKKVAK